MTLQSMMKCLRFYFLLISCLMNMSCARKQFIQTDKDSTSIHSVATNFILVFSHYSGAGAAIEIDERENPSQEIDKTGMTNFIYVCSDDFNELVPIYNQAIAETIIQSEFTEEQLGCYFTIRIHATELYPETDLRNTKILSFFIKSVIAGINASENKLSVTTKANLLLQLNELLGRIPNN